MCGALSEMGVIIALAFTTMYKSVPITTTPTRSHGVADPFSKIHPVPVALNTANIVNCVALSNGVKSVVPTSRVLIVERTDFLLPPQVSTSVGRAASVA
jgi:hypothetical protein